MPQDAPDPQPMGEPTRAVEPAGSTRRYALLIGLSSAVAIIVAVVFGAVLLLRDASRPVPGFPSLQDAPDPSLHGTAAYVDDAGCVQLIAASGAARRELLCIEPFDPAEAEALGKPEGPSLRWLPDGRLEITMFRMTTPPSEGFAPGWQKVVDVGTGAVTETPESDLPTEPDVSGQVRVDPSGTTVDFTSDGASGRIRVELVGSDGERRTLLEAHGPGKYGYGLATAFWGPDFSYVVADDRAGRILVITTDEEPVTRVLATQGRSGFDGALGSYAFTDVDLFGP